MDFEPAEIGKVYEFDGFEKALSFQKWCIDNDIKTRQIEPFKYIVVEMRNCPDEAD